MAKGIVTTFPEICFFCGKPKECEHHLIPGIGRRPLCESDGLKIPLCNKHHNMGSKDEQIHGTAITEYMSKVIGQLAWEKKWIVDHQSFDENKARSEFMKRYGKSYI